MGLILDSSVVIAAERRGDTIEHFIERVVNVTGDQDAALSAIGLAGGSWDAQDAAHGASDNELVIRRGLEPREPSRAPLDRSCLLSPSCLTFDPSDFFPVRTARPKDQGYDESRGD